jgi:hypothetical protein
MISIHYYSCSQFFLKIWSNLAWLFQQKYTPSSMEQREYVETEKVDKGPVLFDMLNSIPLTYKKVPVLQKHGSYIQYFFLTSIFFTFCVNRLLHLILIIHNWGSIWHKLVWTLTSTSGTNLLFWELLIHMIHYLTLQGFLMSKPSLPLV